MRAPLGWFGRPGAPAATPDSVAARIADRGLFIIGHARSGTTVLQNALNASPHIFLLGEPDFHKDAGTPAFGARYGAMHRGWGNQETKSTALPPVLAGDPEWWCWLDRLAELHHRVGAKIVLNPIEDPEHLTLQRFQGRFFYKSAYLFCFRDPLATAVSTWRLADLHGNLPPDWGTLARSLRSVMRLYIRMLRLFPYVHAVFHDTLDAACFDRLGAALGCDLSGAAAYYDSRQVKHYTTADVPDQFTPHYDELARLDGLLRACVAEGPALVQLEQNINNFSPAHRSALGRLSLVLDAAW